MKNYTLVFISLITIAACGGGGGGGSDAPDSGYTTPTNNPPSITNTNMNISVVENQTSAFTVNATDPNGDTLTYSLSGDDASLLSISNQGVVTFNTAPDFENPSDGDTDNVYKITATVSDGSLNATANFEVTVTNDTSDDTTTENYDGTLVLSGPIQSADICFVENITIPCSESSYTTTTSQDGTFSLIVDSDAGTGIIKSENGFGEDFNKTRTISKRTQFSVKIVSENASPRDRKVFRAPIFEFYHVSSFYGVARTRETDSSFASGRQARNNF